jgi:hypothetical protein
MDGKNRHFLIIRNHEQENIKINLFFEVMKPKDISGTYKNKEDFIRIIIRKKYL